MIPEGDVEVDSSSQIIAWLSDIASADDAAIEQRQSSSSRRAPRPSQPASPNRKRRRRPSSSSSSSSSSSCGGSRPLAQPVYASCALQSPPASRHSDMSDDAGPAPRTPKPKRQKVTTTTAQTPSDQGKDDGGDDGGDEEAGDPTPRARKTPSLASSQKPPSSSSFTSGTSSPTKQFEGIALKDDGIEKKTLQKGASGLPEELNQLLEALEDVSDGCGIISTADKATVEARAATDPSFPKLRDFMFNAPVQDHGLGRTPPIDAVLNIANWARRCSESNAHEDTWNAYVHLPLLALAVYGTQLKPQLMNVDMCTHAEIIREYRHLPIPSKRVDFVLHYRPASCADGDPERAVGPAIDKLRQGRPLLSINHTDLRSLNDGPIWASIETKRQHRTGDAAELQIGVWHAAQWKMLSQVAAPAGGGGPGGGGLEGCPFLPGVIISGHDWYFVATTRRGEKTVLWNDFLFGSSKSVVGLYKIIRGLQYIVQDGRRRYWPWFKKTVLDLNTPSGGAGQG